MTNISKIYGTVPYIQMLGFIKKINCAKKKNTARNATAH